jgi:hypothetical protein
MCGINTQLGAIHDNLGELSRKVTDELPLIRSAIENITGKDESTIYQERKDACLASLAAREQTSFVSQILRRSRQAGRWVFENPKYISWRESPGSSLLKITARPGCGKTTLAAHISQQIRTEDPAGAQASGNSDPNSAMLYFFFHKSNHEVDRTAAAALRSMVTQLVQQLPNLLPTVLWRYNSLSQRGSFEWSVENLLGLADGMIGQTPRYTKLHIILDAIDECEDESRLTILDWIQGLVDDGADGSAAPTVKVIITTRPDESVADQLSRFPTLEVTDSDTKDDMRTLIRHRMVDFSSHRHLDPEVTSRITQFLEDNAYGMFLWVVLIMEELARRDERLTDEVIASKLSQIPVTLVSTYEALIQCPPPSRKNEMWRIIRWLIYGRRGLTLAELETAMCLETGTLRWHDFAGDLNFLCGSLIRFDGARGEINLIHQTARDFLKRFVEEAKPHDIGDVQMDPVESHKHLAEICIKYLLRDEIFEELEDIVYSLNHQRKYQHVVGGFLCRYPFLCYAIENWSSHIHALGTPSPPLSDMTMHLLSSMKRRDGIMRITYYILHYGNPLAPVETTSIHLAAYFNLPWLVKIYISESEDGSIVNSVCLPKDTPLIWAAEMGSTACAKILLDAGADPNLVEYDGWSPLHWAARNGHLEVTKLLLDHGANLGQRDSKGLTPLDWAAGSEYWDVFEVLGQRADEEQRLKLEKIMWEKYSTNRLVVIRSTKDWGLISPRDHRAEHARRNEFGFVVD